MIYTSCYCAIRNVNTDREDSTNSPFGRRYVHISTDMLDNVVAIVKPQPEQDNNQEEEKKTKKGKADDNESDVDSLLDSEEDYEEQDVTFFRRHKRQRSHNLRSQKGITHFKRFLRGTAGENLWLLWMDIDKLVLVTSEDEQAL